MVIPLNFVAGAVIGAVTTYVYKDDSSKEWLRETGNKLKEGTSSFMSSFKKKADDTSESVIEVEEKDVVEVSATESNEKASASAT